MNLGGWDVVSTVGVARINAALSAQGGTAATFEFHEGGVRLSGRFGPWQIVPGGSVRLLHVAMPVEEGEYLDSEGRSRKVSLAGLTLIAELALRLIPSSSEPGNQDLVFALDRGDGLDRAQPPVRVLRLEGVDGRIDNETARIVILALGAAMSAHPGRVAHVFARARVGAGEAAGPLAMAHHDWAWLEAEGREGHLALLGSISAPTAEMTPDRIDPRLLGEGSAAFALSDRAFFMRILTPWLNEHLHARGKFAGSASSVRLAGRVALPPQRNSGYVLRPELTAMVFVRSGAGLRLDVKAVTRVEGHSVQILTEMRMQLPLVFDRATGSVSLKPDPHPVSKSWAQGQGFWGGIEAVVANIVLLVARDQIALLAASIAKATHRMNAPEATPVTWPGQPRFHPTTAELSDCFFFSERS